MKQLRVNAALSLAREEGLEALILMPGPNLYYVTGFGMKVSERPTLLVLPVKGEPWVLCPLFEAEKVRRGTGFGRIYPWGEEEGPGPVLARAVRETGVGRGTAGVEYRQMRVLERELIASALAARNLSFSHSNADQLWAELRSVKDAEELALMREAARLVDQGARAAHERIAPGVSEEAVAAYIQAEMQRLGAKGTIHVAVASGDRAGLPHAGTTERTMQEGELAWVDIVYFHRGYCADITRTYPVGRVAGELAEIYAVCCEAQRLACEQARPGMTGAQVDAIARSYIEGKGYGQYFTHRTGHGLGLEGHEEPYIVGSNEQLLAEGMTFTIEPGIYLPGAGGVRIEDDVVLTADGCESLTRYPRNLLQQGR
jgi:Xaa-Pro dipeptidase